MYKYLYGECKMYSYDKNVQTKLTIIVYIIKHIQIFAYAIVYVMHKHWP